MEKKCKGVVSCADILALATRDGVALAGGSAYALPTGWRDGTVSNSSDVHMPTPSSSLTDTLKAFQNINVNLEDLVEIYVVHT